MHFIVKSFVMGQIGSLLTLIIVFFVGKIDFIQLIIIGGFVYIIVLVILRFGNSAVEYLTHEILRFLDRRPKFKKFLLRYF